MPTSGDLPLGSYEVRCVYHDTAGGARCQGTTVLDSGIFDVGYYTCPQLAH